MKTFPPGDSMPAKKPVRSLDVFARQEAQQRGPQCWVCRLEPATRKLIESKRKADQGTYTFDLLARYLRDELGLAGASMFKVRHHFKQHVAA
jgi:hypothetical protein